MKITNLFCGDVLFIFFTDPNGDQQVEILFGAAQCEMPLWQFNKSMLLISEEAERRSRPK